jgi:hypothetical protein
MPYEITPLNHLQLWCLASHGGSLPIQLFKPELDPAQRKALADLGLIELSQGLRTAEELASLPAPKGEEGGAGAAKAKRAANIKVLRLKLAPKGAAWLAEHLESPVSRSAKIPARLVEFLLKGLAATKAGGEVLAGLLGSDSNLLESPKPEAPLDPMEIIRRVRRLDRSQIMAGEGVRLAEVRRLLPEYGRQEVDKALLELQSRRAIILYRFDDPTLITGSDKEAALDPLGNARHYLVVL